jgi:hypothetical protein
MDDLTGNKRIPREDRFHEVVLRLQPDLVLLAEEPFERGFIGEHRHDDVAVVRGLLPLDHHEVAVEDTGVDHGRAGDPEGETSLIPSKKAGDVQIFFDVLVGKQRCAGGHPPHQGNRPKSSTGTSGGAALAGPGDSRRRLTPPADVAPSLEGCEVTLDRQANRGQQPNRSPARSAGNPALAFVSSMTCSIDRWR